LFASGPSLWPSSKYKGFEAAKFQTSPRIDSSEEKKLDWKCVAWDLERIFRKQFALESASVSLNQTNNTLNLMDGPWLQEARDALDDVINVKEARRRQEEAEASIEKGHGAEPERQPASHLANTPSCCAGASIPVWPKASLIDTSPLTQSEG
jgi:hypothetical protein